MRYNTAFCFISSIYFLNSVSILVEGCEYQQNSHIVSDNADKFIFLYR